MAIEGGGYASSGESREDDDQMDVWSDFDEQKNNTCNITNDISPQIRLQHWRLRNLIRS